MARGDFYSGVFGPSGGAPARNPFVRPATLDPWAGMREVGGSPFAQAAPAPMAPTSRGLFGGGGYSPLADPTGPLARAGWIGALLAQGPTRAEYQQQQLGAATQAAITSIGHRITSGMEPRRAIMDFANSPEGAQFMAQGGGFQDLANIAKGLSPAPLPDPMNVAPGGAVYQPGVGELYRNPVSEAQKFQAFSEFANLSDQERQEAARAIMAKDLEGNPTAAEAAMNRLIKSGRISRETADLILGGVISPTPILDAEGNTIGYGIKDLSDPEGKVTMLPRMETPPGQLPQPGSSEYAEGVTPGSMPKDQPPVSDVSADIVDEAGTVGWLKEKIGSILGIAIPGAQSLPTIKGRRQLGRIASDAMRFGRGGNRLLAAEAEELSRLANTLGILTQPKDAAATLIQLHESYDRLERSLIETMNSTDPKITNKVRGDAAIGLHEIRSARVNLPSRESLEAKLEQLGTEQPFERIGGAISGVEKEVEKTINGEPKPQQAPSREFNSMDDLNKAFEAGQVKIGDRVILNGKPFTLAPKGTLKGRK